MNRQITGGDSKNVIVFDPLLTGHVIRRMRIAPYAFSMVTNGKLTNQELIGVGSSNLVARLVT